MAYLDEGGGGVGGWLALFVVLFGLAPIGAVITVYGGLHADPEMALAFGDSWTTLLAFEWTLVALTAGLCWYTVWRLMNVERWSTVRFTIAAIWIVGPGGLLVETGGVALLTGLPPAQLIAELGVDAGRTLVFAIVWTAYFLRSRRVANTYSRSPDEDALVETFS